MGWLFRFLGHEFDNLGAFLPVVDLPVGLLAFDGAVEDSLAAGAAGEGDSVGGLFFAGGAEIRGRGHLDGFEVDECAR